MHRDPTEIELILLETTLAEGSLRGCREKFADSLRRDAIEQSVRELEDGSLYRGDWRRGEIEIVGIVQVVSTRFWLLIVYDVLFPPKKGAEPARGTYQNIVWNVGRDSGSGVLLITEKKEVVLVRSFRHAKRAWTLEIPHGVRRPGESFLECAVREGREECGASLTASSALIDLGVIDADTGIVSQEPHLVAITNVRIDESHVSRDISESWLGPAVMSLPELLQKIGSGEITDAWIATAILRARIRGLI